VIAGWVVRYAFEAFTIGFPADAGAHFDAISTGPTAMAYHLLFMIFTTVIVMGGIEKGIEKASTLMIPALFVILVGLAIWASTLDGAGADAAHADDRHDVTRGDLAGVHRRAPAGDHTATEQAGLVEGDVLLDLDAACLVHHGLVGEGAEQAHQVQILALRVVA
jgi:hypothetical protein